MSEDFAEQTEQTPPYDFGVDPISVNTYRPNDPRANKLRHQLRKPTLDQWLVWGHEIYQEQRNLSPEEIQEMNEGRNEDEHIESGYQRHFSDYPASRRLYEAIAIDVTEYEPDENEELQPIETYPLTPELLDKAILGTHVAVKALYNCYCVLEEDSDANGTNELRVRQTIGASDSPPVVMHVLRKATDEEKQRFATETLRTYLVPDKPDTVRICFDLRVADNLYDSMILNIENATVNGQEFSETERANFLKAVNPVFKLKVLEEALQIELERNL